MIGIFAPSSRPRARIFHLTAIVFYIFSFSCALIITAGSVWAVPPDASLYSEQLEIRSTAYETKEKLLKTRIAATKDENEKRNLLLQQQLLNKLNEIQDEAQALPELQDNSEVLSVPPSWEDFEQFLDKYISIAKESKKSTEDLKTTIKQKQTLYNQLLALAEDDPEQHILQLQHAYQARKSIYQSSIDENLHKSLSNLKDQFPLFVAQLHIDERTIDKQKISLQKVKVHLKNIEEEKPLAMAANDVLIEEQESLLAGYLGQDLSDAEKKTMHYNQLKLLELQVKKLVTTGEVLDSKINAHQQGQKLLWFELLGSKQNFYKLADAAEDMHQDIVRLRKEAKALPSHLGDHETQLSTLRGGNALIGPKAEELVAILEKNLQTTGTQLSAVLQQVQTVEHKARLLKEAIGFKQSSLTSMVTKTRGATDDIAEKIMGILTHPLLSYNGMTLTLFLFIQVLLLLLLGIIINKMYGHFIARIGAQRKWSEQTIHLIQATGKYPFIFIVAMIILSVIGINTSSLALVAGALSVGIGFGMQTIANNLVSGIILLFDKSIRPGDFISLGDGSKTGGFRGNVVQMNTRATVLRTNDNINIIIPNADLIGSKVVNWTYGDDQIRFRIPFSIAYGTDVKRVKALIKNATLELPEVLPHPAPQIWMTEHGSSSLHFVAAIWVKGRHARQPAGTSDTVLTKIYTTLTDNNIEIPFPQMDLRFRSKEKQQADADDATTIMDTLHQKARREEFIQTL